MAVLGAGGGFRDVRQWYTRIAVLERRVCLLYQKRNNQPLGTAFLVGRNLLLSATHVWEAARQSEVAARFDYAVMADGLVSEGISASFSQEPLVALSPIEELDTVLLRLQQPIGDLPIGEGGPFRGWVDLNEASAAPPPGSSITIFQHAEGGPLKVAMNTESVVGFEGDGRYLLYRTDTLPGSSGAPCFDIDWQFVAMHRGRSVERGNHNYGIAFAVIRRWFDAQGLWAAVSEPPMKSKAVPFFSDFSAAGLPTASPFPLESELRKLLNDQGESQRLELKVHPFDGKPGPKPKISDKVINTIAAFMNSRNGGTILIGVDDNRQFVGIGDYYRLVNPQRGDWDGFALWLRQKIEPRLEGSTPPEFFKVERRSEAGLDICCVIVQPAEGPIFVEGQLYVRSDNRVISYRANAMLDYVRRRWPLFGSQPTAASADADAPSTRVPLEAARRDG